MKESIAWLKFKRELIGPPWPRSIRRKREKHVESVYTNKPLDLNTKKPRLDRGDIRLICDRKSLNKKITPPWASQEKIRLIYQEAKVLSETTGIPHVVDHIVPRKHPLVCGLHNEFNLQILTRKENSRKSNKFVTD